MASESYNEKQIYLIIKNILSLEDPSDEAISKVVLKYPDHQGRLFSKSRIIKEYRRLKSVGRLELGSEDEKSLLTRIRMKKVRTLSGVTPVTVLTKPFPCPGQCIFCPSDLRMPKSYIASEPGAQRAEKNKFDPYFQTYNRLVAYHEIGHPTDKVELIILGGTWTSYSEKYQIWFVKRCFDAINDFNPKKTPVLKDPTLLVSPLDDFTVRKEKKSLNKGKTYNQIISLALKNINKSEEIAEWKELSSSQNKNENAVTRCVGLSLETRPDEINEKVVLKLRKLGATKIQIGIQSLDDEILSKNCRGHDVATSKKALGLLRQAGFKIHVHWMPNLFGSTPSKDVQDFKKLFSDPGFRPDELKIYPCALVETAKLMDYYLEGKWIPYTHDELLRVMIGIMPLVPRYCRVTRVVRDFPSQEIVEGNKKTNFRQIAEREINKSGITLEDIRSREIRNDKIDLENLKLRKTDYLTEVSEEIFLEYITNQDKIVGFLRLSIPKKINFINEIKDTAMIREVHIYGQSIELGKAKKGKAQHIGLGTRLIKEAENICRDKGFTKISVISSVGTRGYYQGLGFSRGDLYQHKDL